MTTTNSNSNASNNSKQRLIAIAAVVVVALLAVNAFLLYNKFTQDKKIAEQATELTETEKLKTELEKQYYEALSELEEMRGTNDELNTLIENQQAELKDDKDRIEKLIRNEKDLGRARKELGNLKGQIEQYISEINSLKEQNQFLTDENSDLMENKALLETDLELQRNANTELSTAQAALVSEKTDLEDKNKSLSKTVDFASVVKVNEIEGIGLRTKGNGKVVTEKSASKMDQLKLCFVTTNNEITNAGREQFYVRIINPVGETLAIEELGSGVMTSAATNEAIRYTQIKEYDYNNDETQLCFLWEPNAVFQKGTYDVEIYNKGFLAGTGSFKLK